MISTPAYTLMNIGLFAHEEKGNNRPVYAVALLLPICR